MYHTNRTRVTELLAGMSTGQYLPEIALAVPGAREAVVEETPAAHPDHSSLFSFVFDVACSDQRTLRGAV